MSGNKRFSVIFVAVEDIAVANVIFIATLHSRCGHYIFALWFLSFCFFPCLISAVADWMSTILLHMVWS